MEAVLDSLGQLLLKALPTLILLILFHLYAKWMFYGPMDRVLKKRYEATEGARKKAEESLAKVDAKAAEYDQALRDARAELYQEHEKARRQLAGKQQALLGEARAESDRAVKRAKADLAAEVEAAKQKLAVESESLAEEIVASLLERRAS